MATPTRSFEEDAAATCRVVGRDVGLGVGRGVERLDQPAQPNERLKRTMRAQAPWKSS